MLTSWTKLLAVLTLCSTTTLGACTMDGANGGDDTSDGAANSSESEQMSIVNPDGIIVNISVRQWQTDLRTWQMFYSQCRPSVTVDGVFGPMTTTATECYQRASCLTPDGVVGNDTLDEMCFDLRIMERPDLFSASHCPNVQTPPGCHG